MSYAPRGRGGYKKAAMYHVDPNQQQGPYMQMQQQPHAPPPQQQAPPPPPPQAQVPVINFKPTDTIISKSVAELFPEQVEMYNKLQNKEKQIDLIINRKLVDLQDLQAGINNGSIPDPEEESSEPEILRIFIYNISENQSWQLGGVPPPQQQGAPQPSFTVRVEGRLLNDEPSTSVTRKKFSSFLSSISVELKDPSIPNNIVEWHDSMSQGKTEAERQAQQFDGLDIKRFGSSIPAEEEGSDETKEIEAEILIQPKTYPLLLQIVNDDLAQLVGYKEITQNECFIKIFNYIKANGLFELIEESTKQPDDIKSQHSSQQSIIMVKSDETLFKIFKLQKFSIPDLHQVLSTSLLKPADPIKVSYKINTLTNSTLGDVVIDVNLKQFNKGFNSQKTSSINKLIGDLVNDTKTALELQKLQDKISLNLNLLNYNKYKYDFYKKLSENPSGFLNEVLQKNSNFLKILSSDNFQVDGADSRSDEEILRKAEFYKDEKINEYVELLLNSGRI